MSYHWPQNKSLQEALLLRNQLEYRIKNDVNFQGYLSKNTFDAIMIWGFGHASNLTEHAIKKVTISAFNYLSHDMLYEAALALTSLPGIGISRASKILALSDQSNLGIYDSRAAHGLSDLSFNGFRLLPIPPGRVISGDSHLSTEHFCTAFENYIWVLRYFVTCCQKDPSLSQHFIRVSDLEIAFFSRSRLLSMVPTNQLSHSLTRSSLEEGDCYSTLGYGDKAKSFWDYVDESGITVLTGPEGQTACKLKNEVIIECLAYFSNSGWFLLGNAIDNVKPSSLGEYFKDHLKLSPKFASHFASILYSQGRLSYRYGPYNRVELKVNQ
ncbi:MAG: hypothetical protein ABFD18_16080 [Syntrophomonas sp.]